jgi:GTP cyclohydrolase I
MKDVQSQPDFRNIPIDKVGIKNLRYPITVRDRRDGFQHTIASIDMFVDLPHNNKGTHMSRFVNLHSRIFSSLRMIGLVDLPGVLIITT